MSPRLHAERLGAGSECLNTCYGEDLPCCGEQAGFSPIRQKAKDLADVGMGGIVGHSCHIPTVMTRLGLVR